MNLEVPVAAHDAPHTAEEGVRLKRSLLMVGAGYFILILADPRDGIAKISIQYLLKDHLHLPAAQVAAFLALVSLGWYFKPIAGLLTDAVPFLGTRRRGYMIASACVAAVLWLVLGLIAKSYETMLWLIMGVTIALVIGQTTLGGYMVESGKALRATGRMASQRNAAESGGMLIAGLIGGWLAAHFLGIGFVVNTVLLAGLIVIYFFLLREKRAEKRDAKVLQTALSQLKILANSRTMLAATLFWMLVRFSPGFQTPLFFYQTETLKLKPEFIGFLAFINGGCALIACLIYSYCCKRFPLRNMLSLGVCCNLAAILCYFSYRTPQSAMVVEGLYGFGNSMAFLPILDLLARATPTRSEALGYSLIFSFGNISLAVSDIFGSWLFQQFNKNFMDLVWVNFGTSALVLVAIRFLPKMLVMSRDGQRTEAQA